MPSTHRFSSAATPAPAAPCYSPPLVDAFAAVVDPRCRRGRRFTLAALLTLALVAMLANHLSPFAIAAWGAEQDAASKRAMGFAKGITPHQSTFQRLFRRLDPAALSVAVTSHRAADASPDAPMRGAEGVAIDGKAQRSRRAFATTSAYPVHALTACTHEPGAVLAQEEIVSDAEKAEAELTVAARLIARIDWRGRVLTGDALFCQRTLCGQVGDAGGERERSEPIVIVKENQLQLHRDIAALFASRADIALRAASLPAWDMRATTTVEKGHGRVEVRHLIAATALNEYLDWPGLGDVFMVARHWREEGSGADSLRMWTKSGATMRCSCYRLGAVSELS